MSASLVGSEMCIRDRFLLRSMSTGFWGEGGRGGWQGHRDIVLARPFKICLLYTSDAADDM
eukprot:3220688-Alexandrium_andersonii.AAC.1